MSAATAIGRAPGRLDFLGGVADYSGALVLETPIAAQTRVAVTALDDPRLELRSAARPEVILDAAALSALLAPRESPARVRALLDELEVPRWARYSLGCLGALVRRKAFEPARGYRFQISSEVPESMGVSSSAALEVATLRALGEVHGLRFSGTELARLGQEAENHFVGAPCGLMDQLSAAHGVRGALLPILCRPDQLSPPVALPAHVQVLGWPSGARHDVGASPYLITRTATAMGKGILERESGVPHTYLTEHDPPPALLERVPEHLCGRDFLERCEGVDDPLACIDPERSYPVRAALRFPIEEHRRSARALELLRSLPASDPGNHLAEIGELLYASHAGYGEIGLGHPQTDRMVAALRTLGPTAGIYGARISGGGSGGTVVILLEREAIERVRALGEEIFTASCSPQALIQ